MDNYENIQRNDEINDLFWALLNEIDGLTEIDKFEMYNEFKSANTSNKIVALIMVKDYLFKQDSKGEIKCLRDQSHFLEKK